jgi:plastocyanin
LLTFTNNVRWINNDDTAHTVTPDHRHSDGYTGDFGSEGVLKPGDTYDFLFTEPQEVHYHCTPHPWMTGSVTVEKSRF